MPLRWLLYVDIRINIMQTDKPPNTYDHWTLGSAGSLSISNSDINVSDLFYGRGTQYALLKKPLESIYKIWTQKTAYSVLLYHKYDIWWSVVIILQYTKPGSAGFQSLKAKVCNSQWLATSAAKQPLMAWKRWQVIHLDHHDFFPRKKIMVIRVVAAINDTKRTVLPAFSCRRILRVTGLHCGLFSQH